jgi:hypothetical protein
MVPQPRNYDLAGRAIDLPHTIGFVYANPIFANPYTFPRTLPFKRRHFPLLVKSATGKP